MSLSRQYTSGIRINGYFSPEMVFDLALPNSVGCILSNDGKELLDAHLSYSAVIRNFLDVAFVIENSSCEKS
jgi:hypothetical protein